MPDELRALDELRSHGVWPVFGRDLRVSNLDKVLFPARPGEEPVRKRDLLRYAAQIVPIAPGPDFTATRAHGERLSRTIGAIVPDLVPGSGSTRVREGLPWQPFPYTGQPGLAGRPLGYWQSDREEAMDRHVLGRTGALMLLTAGPPTVEAGLLLAVGPRSALPLAPQVTGPPPFGVLHDLRWLAVYHNTWWTYALELLALIAVRGTLDAAIVAAAWPSSVPRPRFARLVAAGLASTAIAAVALTPWAAAAVAASVTSLSWFLIGELLPLLVLVPVLQWVPVLSRCWRGLPSLPGLGWSMVAFVALTVGSILVGLVPAPATVVVAAAAGALNGLLWRQVVRVGVTGRVPLARMPFAPIVAVLTVITVLLFGRLATLATQAAERPPGTIGTEGTSPYAIMYVAGYDSTLHNLTAGPGLHIVPFSYRGTAPDGQPLPYPSTTTHQSLALSAALLAEQVAALHDRTGRPVALVAESEGTLVVRTYLQTLPHPSVHAVVLHSPLIQPGRVYFPPRAADSGWGIATGWELRAMVRTVRSISGTHVSADEPFIRSILDQAPLYRDQMLCPVPGVRMIAFLPFADAALASPGTPVGIPVVEEPGLHALLLTEPSVQQRIVRFLHGDPVASSTSVRFRLIQLAAAAWQTPPLAAGLNPVWRDSGDADPTAGCAQNPTVTG